MLVTCRTHPQSNQINDEPVTVYSHGYLGNKWFSNIFHTSPNFFCRNGFITGPMITFNYDDYAKPLLCYLGQGKDMERLHEACKNQKKVILVGTSRGAATIINYLGTYKPTNVIAAVVESTFDSAETVADNVLAKCNIKDKQKIKNKLRPILFRNYKPDHAQPITTAQHIPKEIPILIVCSQEDGLIPASSTIEVYDTLRNKAGHTQTYLLNCEHGGHARILWGKDGIMFRNVVHAFYKHHGLPYHAPWADDGHARFTQCPGFSFEK